jgi:hypothetical protein
VAYDRRVIIAFVNLHDLSGEAPSKLLTREWSLAQAWGGDTKGIHVIRDLTPESQRQPSMPRHSLTTSIRVLAGQNSGINGVCSMAELDS